MYRGGNIQGVVHLQNHNYSVRKALSVAKKYKMAMKIPILVTTIKMKIMMKYNSVKEMANGASNETQHQNKAHPKNSPIDCDGVQLTIAQWYSHPHHDTENAKLYNWNINLKPNKK